MKRHFLNCTYQCLSEGFHEDKLQIHYIYCSSMVVHDCWNNIFDEFVSQTFIYRLHKVNVNHLRKIYLHKIKMHCEGNST